MSLSGEALNADAVNRLVSGYRTLPGVSDEMFLTDGSIRPVWTPDQVRRCSHRFRPIRRVMARR